MVFSIIAAPFRWALSPLLPPGCGATKLRRQHQKLKVSIAACTVEACIVLCGFLLDVLQASPVNQVGCTAFVVIFRLLMLMIMLWQKVFSIP